MRDDEMKFPWHGNLSNIPRTWGNEECWGTSVEGVHGKFLNIRAGESTSLKYYKIKDETLVILAGHVRVTYYGEFCNPADPHLPDTEPYVTDLKTNSVFCIPSGCTYRIEAVTDSRLIEVGNHWHDPAVKVVSRLGKVDEKVP